VNQYFYSDGLWHLQEDVWQKQKWYIGDGFLHHNNAPAHSLTVQEFLAKNGMTVVLHPPYS